MRVSESTRNGRVVYFLVVDIEGIGPMRVAEVYTQDLAHSIADLWEREKTRYAEKT